AASLLPVDLFAHLWQGPRDALTLYRDVTTLYFSLVPGAVTLSLAAFLVVTGLRTTANPADRRDEVSARGRRALWVFAALGGLDDPVSNWALKESNGLSFLADALGPWVWACAAGVALVQLTLDTQAARAALSSPACGLRPGPLQQVRGGGLSSPRAALL